MSAGRFVVIEVSYSERWSGAEWPGKNGVPEAKVVSSAAHWSQGQGAAYLGVRFPTTSAAAEWVTRECAEWGNEPDEFVCFTTKRELESYLSDCSYRGMFGARA